MTTIAGVISSAGASSRHGCEAILAGNPAKFATPIFRLLGGACFGRSFRHGTPQDHHDSGPLSDGRYLLAADIRIDNRAELISSLNQSVALTACDSQLLILAWQKWGEGCLERIVGDFAFALWDNEDRQLVLARDHTGQRPLHFACAKDAIAVSSTPAGLLRWADRSFDFNFPRLAASIIGAPHFGMDSLFRGIHRVLPGHFARWRLGAVTQHAYWQPPRQTLLLKPTDYLETYRHLLDTSVGSRTGRLSGSLGTHLSAGFDSSAVAATAARLMPEAPPIAFTCAPRKGFNGPVPPGRLADESEIAGIAARHNGMPHVVVRPNRGVLADLHRNARFYQDPAINLVNMEWWTEILRQAQALGVSAMLVGVMGNLSLHASGLSILPQWIRERRFHAWAAQAWAAAARPDVRWRGVLYNSFADWLPPFIVDRLQATFRGIPLAQEQSFFRAEWWPKLPNDRPPPIPAGCRYPARLTAIRSLDVGLLRKGALADTGVEERDATADRRLIDFSFALPPEQLLDHGRYHPLARHALADRLPTELLDSPQRGLQGADWYERFDTTEAVHLVEEFSSCHSANELIDVTKIRRALDKWPSEGTADPRLTVLFRMRLLMALATGAFLQEFEGDLSG